MTDEQGSSRVALVSADGRVDTTSWVLPLNTFSGDGASSFGGIRAACARAPLEEGVFVSGTGAEPEGARVVLLNYLLPRDVLKALERDGLISRKAFPTVPVTVEYALTPLGRKLTEAVAAFAHWAEANMDAIRKAQVAYDQRTG